ncbi:MAG TPA: glycosyltransferase [Bacteroidia bacterium]|nr:glycosyltransferase [Bacteroidia bacterium]
MSDYAIIVPAYNEEAYLPTTLATLREAMAAVSPEHGSGELIVVDNNSHDRTAEVAREHGADSIVFEPHNQIARARNAGAAATQAEHLVFVDADTAVPPSALRQALDALASGEVVGGGARVAMDREVTPTVAWIVRTWEWISIRLRYAAGSFFFVRRDAFEAVGGFDEAVYAGEEVWFGRRVKTWARKRRLGFVILADPPVVTSGRKSDWYSTKDFLLQIAIILFIPWAGRSKRLCAMWYRRPE